MLYNSKVSNCSNSPVRKVFQVTNKGRRQQYLIWAIEGYHIAKDKRKLMGFNAQDIKNKVPEI